MRESGPWDVDEPHPEGDRVDLGGLRMSVSPDFDVQLAVVGDQPVGVVVLRQESALQLHAFAAPKRTGLWDEVRAKLAASVKDAGGETEERSGPFGAELVGQVPAEGGLQSVRYIGVDGPRWFLRAVISGRAVLEEEAAAKFEAVISDLVIVRGEEPMAPEEPIFLRLPTENRGVGDDANTTQDPFKRGPEMTETR